MHILINQSELTLKGRNRQFFVDKLVRHIEHELGQVHITQLYGRFLIDTKQIQLTKDVITKKLARIAGIANFSFITIVHGDIADLEHILPDILKSETFTTFAIRSKRHDKSYHHTSQEMNITVGTYILTHMNKTVNLTNPDLTLYIDRQVGSFYVYTHVLQGQRGLPIGSQGRVLCLLSGGIDSPVAAYLMARRGCSVHFIHFHAFANNKHAEQSKIANTVSALALFMMNPCITYVPYTAYQLATLDIHSRNELIIFRRYMLRVAEYIAIQQGYQALVTGDSLGQVASQTLENLAVTEQAVNMPVFRPLLTYIKDEIISVAKKIGTYELAIQPYKDCCSLIQKHPHTKSVLANVLNDEKKIPLDAIIEASIQQSL